MTYDIKITNGTIIDGTGEAGYVGDVGIRDGKIVALRDAPESADRTIDAAGKVVCPGFIDIHTHYDAQIIWDRMLTISPWHGVTTVVIGNCGFGIAPTRPKDRDVIVYTLEKVEGMSVNALHAGLGDWPFETFPEYLDAIEHRGTGGLSSEHWTQRGHHSPGSSSNASWRRQTRSACVRCTCAWIPSRNNSVSWLRRRDCSASRSS